MLLVPRSTPRGLRRNVYGRLQPSRWAARWGRPSDARWAWRSACPSASRSGARSVSSAAHDREDSRNWAWALRKAMCEAASRGRFSSASSRWSYDSPRTSSGRSRALETSASRSLSRGHPVALLRRAVERRRRAFVAIETICLQVLSRELPKWVRELRRVPSRLKMAYAARRRLLADVDGMRDVLELAQVARRARTGSTRSGALG